MDKVSNTMTDNTRHPTAIIELVGAYIARHVESGTTVDFTARRNRNTTKSPIPVLCRELIAMGHDPETRAHIIRRTTDQGDPIPVFKRDRRISVWADLDAVENERTPLRFIKYKPFPDGAVKADFKRETGAAISGPHDPATRVNGDYRLPGNGHAAE